MTSNTEWMERERKVREAHRRLHVALVNWPRPRPIEQIEAEEPQATGLFVQPANDSKLLKTPEVRKT